MELTTEISVRGFLGSLDHLLLRIRPCVGQVLPLEHSCNLQPGPAHPAGTGPEAIQACQVAVLPRAAHAPQTPADDAASAVESGVEQAAEAVEGAADQAVEVAEDVADRAAEGVQEGVRVVADAAEQAADAAIGAAEGVAEGVQEATSSFTKPRAPKEYRPLTSMPLYCSDPDADKVTSRRFGPQAVDLARHVLARCKVALSSG